MRWKDTISKKIKKVLVDEDMQTTDLAKLLDCTPENLYLKLKRDNWKESDVQKIADVLGYEYIQELRKRRWSIIGMTKKIKILLLKREMTQRDLANRLGISQPTLSKKFALDDWRESDLRKIADVCNCQYDSSFILGDERIS